MSADSPDASSTVPRDKRRSTFVVCAILLIVFGLTCYLAVSTKSATSDEPLHVAGAYAHVFMRDYRLNPEDPPLWNYWVMLPRTRASLQIPTTHELWPRQLDDTAYGMPFSSVVLFTAENDGAQFIQSSRAMMVPLGVVLGAIISFWAWQIAGRIGAIVATMLFAFDPNFLAHAGLVKNDVPLTLAMTAMCFATWRIGCRATLLNVMSAALLVGAGMTTKFSGVLLAPIFVAMMFARSIIPGEWNVLRRPLKTRRARLVACVSILAFAALVTWMMIWLAYGFRFDPTPNRGERLNMERVVQRTAELKQGDPGIIAHTVTSLERHRILPQGWLYGFLYTYQSTLSRTSFLLGEIRTTGWWYYFPLAMLIKTPVVNIVACLFAGIALLRVRASSAQESRNDLRWTLACLLIPLAIYMTSAMTSNLNLGIRHVLPVYPFIYLLIALAAKRIHSMKPRLFGWTAPILGCALVIETLAAFPNYLAFFNAPSRPFQLKLLSDSNLDWGQDLLLLAAWQDAHPNTRLYVNYFGSVDPGAYGIRYINLPGSIYLNPDQRWPDAPGVIAISASRLQGMHMSDELRDRYRALLEGQQPIDILGGSIYLYEYPPISPK